MMFLLVRKEVYALTSEAESIRQISTRLLGRKFDTQTAQQVLEILDGISQGLARADARLRLARVSPATDFLAKSQWQVKP